MKILCFHPALAPYRIDFFNLLCASVELKILFLQTNLFSQKFDQAALRAQLKCPYGELTRGFDIKGRCIRFGARKAIVEENPDVVLAYEASPVTLLLILYKKLLFRRLKIWTFMDDSPSQVRSRRGLRKFVRDWVIRNVNKVIVPSGQAAAAYPSAFPSSRFAPVPIIHDENAIRENADAVYSMATAWRKEHISNGWTKVLLFVGRLAKVKNLDWLIAALPVMKKSIGLVLVGNGEEEETLKAQVATLGLRDRVIFAGRKEGDELYSMMAMADALVLCSHSEPFGAVVAEALQWGTPCVVSENCGAAMLIEDGVNGCVFPYSDIQAFVRIVMNLPFRADYSLLNVSLADSVVRLTRGI